MSNDRLIAWSTRATLYCFVLLLLVLFVAGVTLIFKLKVFGERTSEGLWFLIPFLIAGMAGSLMLNVVSNLNKLSFHIALRSPALSTPEIEASDLKTSTFTRKTFISIAALLLGITAFLFAGDQYTKNKKEDFLLADAKATVAGFKTELNKLEKLEWGKELLQSTHPMLSLMSKQNQNFPSITLLLNDSLNGNPVVVELGAYNKWYDDEDRQLGRMPEKATFVRALSIDEKAYLETVFSGKREDHRYSAYNGKYELFYPVKLGNKTGVLYFSQHMRYGKSGS